MANSFPRVAMHLPRAVIAVVFVALLAGGGASGAGAPRAWPRGAAVVGYRSSAALQRALARYPAVVVRRVPALRVVEVRPLGSVSRFAAGAARVPGIAYVERLVTRAPSDEPALLPSPMPGGAYEWQYAATRENAVPDNVMRAAKGITIAVIDTGADVTAPDLAAKSPATWSILRNSTQIPDPNGHGTFVAALAAGSVTNGEGIAGFGGDAKLLILQAGNSTGNFSDLDEAAAIQYAVDHGAKIINLSIGGDQTSSTERAAVEYAADHGVLLVAAAGNEYGEGDPIEYPAALLQPNGSDGKGGLGLSVGGSDLAGKRASFSNTGSYVSLVAPGENVFSALASSSSDEAFQIVTLPGSHIGIYGFASGTSFAAPEVAGAAALVWAANPLLSAQQVAAILKETSSGKGTWDADVGYGVIDVAGAVEQASNGAFAAAHVDLRGKRIGSKVQLTWTGRGAATYRLSVQEDNGPTRVVLPSTTERSASFDVSFGHTYAFTVSVIDATGAEAARSAPVVIDLPRATAALSLAATPTHGRVPLKVVLSAKLSPQLAGASPGGRTVVLEAFSRGAWRDASSTLTSATGRARWSFTLGRGVYRLRAHFTGTDDLAGATSAAIVIRVG